MPKDQKRDYASYYEPRLKNEHPTIYADLHAGKYPSLGGALQAAGLRKRPSALTSLKSAWKKASSAEQEAFLREIGASLAATPPSGATLVAIDRRLTSAAKLQIRSIMNERRLSMGDVMKELGFSRLNPSLGLSLSRDSQVKDTLISALEKWLEKHL